MEFLVDGVDTRGHLLLLMNYITTSISLGEKVETELPYPKYLIS